MQNQIQNDLPNFPAEVIEQWLLPFAEDEGWPPIANRWRYLLVNPDLNYWRSIIWSLEEVELVGLDYTQMSIKQIHGLIDVYVNDNPNMFTMAIGENGKVRFRFQFQHLQKHGQLIIPPVFVQNDGGYDIMDGNHRMAAIIASLSLGENNKADILQKVWIGRTAV